LETAFRAKWWSQGDVPQVEPTKPYNHPWQYMGYVKAPD